MIFGIRVLLAAAARCEQVIGAPGACPLSFMPIHRCRQTQQAPAGKQSSLALIDHTLRLIETDIESDAVRICFKYWKSPAG